MRKVKKGSKKDDDKSAVSRLLAEINKDASALNFDDDDLPNPPPTEEEGKLNLIQVESPFPLISDPPLLSSEKSIYQKIYDPENSWNAVRMPDVGIFDDLNKEFPNFSGVIDLLKTFAHIGRLRPNMIMKFPPILLTGGPGLGKTEFITELTERIGAPFFSLNCPGNSGGAMALSGSDMHWENTSPGLILSALLKERVVNPVILLDELDKTPIKDKQVSSVFDVLLPLMEQKTAKKFTDEHLPEIPFDASRIIWFATANDPNSLPEPLLSRFRVFEIGPFPPDQLPRLVERLISKTLETLDLKGYLNFQVRDDDISLFKGRSPREIRQSLEGAIASRFVDLPNDLPSGIRLVLREGDLEKSLVQKRETRKVGFRI